MKQFGKILKFELKYYLKNKVFVGVTVFLVLLIAAVMFFPRITAMFEEDNTVDVGDIGNVEIGDEQNQDDLPVMLIKAEEAELAEMVRETFAAAFNGYNVQITDSAIDDVKSTITAGEAECAFVLTSPIEYIYYVNNLSMYDSNAAMADEMLRHLYQTNALVQSGLTAEEAGDIMNIFVSGSVESLGKDQMENFFYTYIMIFALYMVILLYGQMVATNVATEKSSRAMEVLITSAKPTSMMFGKVIASCLAGLIQLVAVFGSALVFYNLNKSYWGGNMIIDSIFNIPTELFVYMLVFFILGFLIYAFMFGAVGSTASKLEDINTSVMPITLLFIIAFIVVMTSMSSGNVDNTLMKVASFIPFTSPMAMFTRICMSTVPLYEILISIAILIGSTVGIGVISAKIYRVGVLLYGTTPKLGAILKAVWKA
ncbi:MAG: ABC transporter permease [Clostridia bacterium]|nr:ABC transporter permease [Clostridia bacterium]